MVSIEQVIEALQTGGMRRAAATKWAPRIHAAMHHQLVLADAGYADTQTLDALRLGVIQAEAVCATDFDETL